MGTSKFIVDDGLHEVVLENNKGEVFCNFFFHPADMGLIERYEHLVDFLNTASIDDEDGDTPQAITKLETEVKEEFDKLLNRKVSGEVFKVYSPCTLFANGDMFVEVLIKHIGEVIEKESGQRLKKKVAKIKKATEKNRV